MIDEVSTFVKNIQLVAWELFYVLNDEKIVHAVAVGRYGRLDYGRFVQYRLVAVTVVSLCE